MPAVRRAGSIEKGRLSDENEGPFGVTAAGDVILRGGDFLKRTA
jgi:hypothetical protein